MQQFYWFAQAAFVALFIVAATSASLSPNMLVGAGVIQLGLVGWRLRLSRAWIWVALIPPASTAAIWWGLGSWAVREDARWGGDGAGLVVAMVSFVWCPLAYAFVGLWAGLRPVPQSVH